MKSDMFMGMETEYAVFGRDGEGRPVPQGVLCEALIDAARRKLVHMSDGTPHGMFLSNGSRLYQDHGFHPELSTSECNDPVEVLRYLRAGDEILSRLMDDVRDKLRLSEASVLRSNIDYGGTGSTWASHESLMYRCEPGIMGPQLIPHLASRIVLCGAGGFSNVVAAQLKFGLSPRAWHIVRSSSTDSTHDRGIWHRKNEPLGEGYNRLHLLTGESLCSELATFLRIGTTAVVVAMIDAGLQPGDAVQLQSPVVALRTFGADPYCRQQARLTDGRRATALEIQRHYLEIAEANVGRTFMPPFAEGVCREWRRVLDLLASGPRAISTLLDWGIKFELYTRQLERAGFDWIRVAAWNKFLTRIFPCREAYLITGAVLGRDEVVARVRRWRATHPSDEARNCPTGDESELIRFLEIRERLFELDTRFAQLGPAGLFNALDRSGVLEHHVHGVERIDEAVDYPPPVGRARARGDAILEHAHDAERYVAEWHGIYDSVEARWLDLSDPERSDAEWRAIERSRPRNVEEYLRQRLRRLFPRGGPQGDEE